MKNRLRSDRSTKYVRCSNQCYKCFSFARCLSQLLVVFLKMFPLVIYIAESSIRAYRDAP